MKTELTEKEKIQHGNMVWDIMRTKNDGEEIIFLHGNSSSYNSFMPLFESSLAERYQLIAINLPGHGETSLPLGDHITIPEIANMASELILHITKGRYLVVGHSLGGHVLSHALHRLKHCLGLILISAPPISMQTMADAFLPDPSDGALFSENLSEEQIHRMAEALLGSQKDNKSLLDVLVGSINNTQGHFRKALGLSLQAGNLKDELAMLSLTKVPVALIWGTNDKFIREDFYRNIILERTLGKGKYAIEGAGHSPHLEDVPHFQRLLSNLCLEISLVSGCTSRRRLNAL